MSVRYISTQGFDRAKRNALSLHQHLQGYPRTAKTFIRVDNNLRVYWHTLFDLCPELLRLDPPEGEELFRGFMRFATARNLPLNWTLHLNLYRWLQGSPHAQGLQEEHLEAVMAAAASLWCDDDASEHAGIALVHRDSALVVVGWKALGRRGGSTLEVLQPEARPRTPGDFVFLRLPQRPCSLERGFEPVFTG
ncbi:TPA: putative natural product biosynthesis protein [Pseudomonas aeruginosa]